jgi:hypothetical protein
MKHRQMIREATMRGNEMAKNPTTEEAVERARALQDSKIDAVRVLAESNQNVTDARERAAEAERDYVRVFGAALTAGWTPDELRKIGFANGVSSKPTTRRKSSVGRVVTDTSEANSAGERSTTGES